MEYKPVSYWGTCPAEILVACFAYLDTRDLLACTGVNPIWRANADYCGKKNGKWVKLLEDSAENKGLNFIQRSKLDFKEVYFNCRMWYFMHRPRVELKHAYNLKGVQKIHVHRDSLIAVCKDSVKFYNLEAGTLTKEILETCLDYQETDYLVGKFTRREDEKHILLYCKVNNETFERLGFRLCNIQHNKCHLTNAKNCVDCFVSTPNRFVLQTLGRYYSSPRLLCSLHMYRDDMFIYTSKGDVYHRRDGELGINRVCTLDVPNPPGTLDIKTEIFMTMFHKCSVVYGVKTKEREKIVRNYDIHGEEHLVLFYFDLSCAVYHDDVLLLGFNDGKVAVVLIKTLWTTYDLTPAFQFYIQEVTKVKDVAITHLEVYEADGCHHLLVATKRNLYQFIVSDADFEKVMA